jgi:3'-phosphoadenosine 5'-phosphosulfate sulfotransferase (PAPS reductase)/FAD synthetase
MVSEGLLFLFCTKNWTLKTMRDLFPPHHALHSLRAGAKCAIGFSGGKDSQALLLSIGPWFRDFGFSGRLFAVFADLGRAEWRQTPSFVQQICEEQNIELVVVRRATGNLLQRFEERMQSMGSQAPIWPSAAFRYCTSDTKRFPIDTYLRRSHLVQNGRLCRYNNSSLQIWTKFTTGESCHD